MDSKPRWIHRLAEGMVWLANRLVKPPKKQLTYNFWPKYRPIDQAMKSQGSYKATKYSVGAYSYEGLKSLVEQDGPDGFGANATVAWLISDDGWVTLADLKHDDGTPYTAQESADMISKDLTLEATRQEQKKLQEQDHE